MLKTTRYFREQVLRKRPYLRTEWLERILQAPMKREVQKDGRIRLWGRVEEFDNRIIRVVLLEDGVTVLNAFPDRRFAAPEQAQGADR